MLTECPRCHGTGEIRFNDSPGRDPQHDDSAPCGTCYGEGGGPRCPECGQPKDTPITWTYCVHCTAWRVPESEDELRGYLAAEARAFTREQP